MPSKAEREHDALTEAALEQLDGPYLEALQAQFRGEGAVDQWEEFRRIFARSWVLSGLLGSSNVVNHLQARGFRLRMDNQPLGSGEVEQFAQKSELLTGPFIDAINAFINRVPQLRRTVDQLSREARRMAFWVSDVESDTAIQKIQEKLAEPLQGVPEGGDMQDFFDFAENEAAVSLSRARLETVFRTNVQTAQNSGAYRQLNQDGVKDQTALWQLNEVRDKRTRGNPSGLYPDQGVHWQMDGFVEEPGHDIWRDIWPPNGYNCRATVEPVPWPEARRKGWAQGRQLIRSAIERHNGNRWNLIQNGRYPDDGFDGGPMGNV